MALAASTKLGPYEIVGAAGAGGMGEVYRARDTRLDRTVAIKVLPGHLSSNPELRQRFEREARAISSLNHPHICHLYDVGSQNGTDFLVMEYVEGETLAQRLEKGPLPLEQVIKIGAEIADALDKAHRQGIVHRDLKPGNIMLAKGGAKLMDFGLAKPSVAPLANAATAPLTPSTPTMSVGNLALSTAPEPLTRHGTIVGTFQYMAPEVLQGAEADARSDIFSLGCVLYEMATGRRAFEGKSQLSVLAAILEKEPEPIGKLQPLTPPALEHTVATCLAKDPDERWQSAHDIVRELQWISTAGAQAAPPVVRPRRRRREWLAMGIAAAAVIALLAVAAAQVWWSPAPKIIQATVLAPDKFTFDATGDFGGPAVLSPDGEKIVFAAHGPDRPKALWVRSLNSAAAQRLDGTEGASFPFWSPDSRFVGFFANGELNKIPAGGGPVIPLAPASNPRGGSWSRKHVILYAPNFIGGLMRISAEGGTAQPATTLDPRLHTTHRWPWFLPDGRHFLYLATNHSGGNAQENGIYYASLDGKENRLLLATDAGAQYASGYLLFHSQTTLMAQRFDADKGKLLGDAVPVVDKVQDDNSVWRALFSASGNGLLLYQSGTMAAGTQLVWVDRSGKLLGSVGERGEYLSPRISPDGKRILVAYGAPSEDMWVFDLKRNVKTRVTFDPTTKMQSAWSPDGKTIAYIATNAAGYQPALYTMPANGAGQPHLLLQEPKAGFNYPSYTPDGKSLLFTYSHGPTGAGIYRLPLDGSSKPSLVLAPSNPQGSITDFRISPDGRWIAYVSNESGQTQVYVAPASGNGGKWQISTKDGDNPTWRGDGKELFYNDSADDVFAVDVIEKDTTISFGQVNRLFHLDAAAAGIAYDVSTDGQRFLFNQGTQDAATPLNLVVNWTAQLKK
jgi:Tol biopolymer transport system component/predicted Ser/Thr protein kinase